MRKTTTESGVRTGNLILVSVWEQDFLTISTGKRKHDEISSGYYLPQRDGAADDELSTSMGEACHNVVSSLLPTSPRETETKIVKGCIWMCCYLKLLDSIITHFLILVDQDLEGVGSWVTERSVGRSEDSRLWLQHRQSADAAIEQMIRAKCLLGMPSISQLDGLDDEFDDVGV